MITMHKCRLRTWCLDGGVGGLVKEALLVSQAWRISIIREESSSDK